MINELHNYDIFPKVVPVGKEVEITVRPLGDHARGSHKDDAPGITIFGLDVGYPGLYADQVDTDISLPCTVHDDGSVTFKHTFLKEQEYFVRVNADFNVQLSIYAVDADLVGRYPFIGDLHMHTFRSDGQQSPAVVCANYRKHGYDFLAITDHGRYYPSLEAMEAFADLPLDYELVPGEEVHMPGCDGFYNDIHIVNFGGKFSVNGLAKESPQVGDRGEDKKYRSLHGDCEEVRPIAEIMEEVSALCETLNIPEELSMYKTTYAMCVWIFEKIKAGEGLAIYCHPFWRSFVYQVPLALNDYILKEGRFDAFEVLGGENYYEQNGLQTHKYYELRASGYDFPIVGVTDSHSSFNNIDAYVASTMVFSPANERGALIDSVKEKYSIAIDGVSKEYRLVGDFRLAKYAAFLLKHFFPLHDDLCYEEGRAMKAYACGDPDAEEILRLIAPRMKRQREKYFAF